MKTLDPFVIPLESINLIEASAGTGKSWTVTLLYLRLILEKGLTVDQILLVTFTDAATKELRDDIRQRLTEALAAFEDADYSKDDEYKQLIVNSSNTSSISNTSNKVKTNGRDELIRRLNQAKLSLDEAAIFTIHSFCQRALTENAFQAGLPFESELMDDDRELMQKLTDDFWRRNFNKAPSVLLFKLQQKSITPDSLLDDIYSAVGKPYLKLYGPQTDDADSAIGTELEIKFTTAMTYWKEQRAEVMALLQNPELEKGYYKAIVDHRDLIFSIMDDYACLKRPPASIDSKTDWLGTKEKTKANYESLEHPFFQLWQDFLDSWKILSEASDTFLNQIRIQLLKYLQQELPKEKLRLGVLSFDDLLLQLQNALRINSELAKDLRKKYKAALIDEFQDTDPIQYEIFNRIFAHQPKHAVFFVGDPKQAIYSFRGGDIHTYLKAKTDTLEENHYTLETNWRSHPDLISAFNSLYSSADNPFRDEDIKYNLVNAGNIVTDKLITPDKRNSLSFWKVDVTGKEPENENNTTSKKSAPIIREEIADAVAGDIAMLLNAAQKGQAKIGENAITGGDIAILIRSHTQGDLIKQALSAKGIASVQSSKDSIFQTKEAEEMYRLITAIAEPQREDNVRRALVTELMAYDAEDLLSFEENGNLWEDKLLAVQQWHYLWQKKGFLPMMHELMHTEKMHQHLLNYDDGERRLTNVIHLSELIHKQSKRQSLSMEEVLRWLRKQQQNSDSKESELRLESDDKLVKIVTIHKSKGLEYPIVYCPFVGVGSRDMGSNTLFIFHKDKKACLEIGSSELEQHQQIKTEEARAEDTRLLYVALTRAKYQCTVVCVPEVISGTPDRTALGWLLSNGQSIQSGRTKAIQKNNNAYYQAYNEQLDKLASENAITLTDLPYYDNKLCYQPMQEEQELTARCFTGKIIQQSQITSFSGLTAAAHSEMPDFDKQALQDNIVQAIASEPPTDAEFPKGAAAGTALHEIYENLDFIQPINEQTKIVSEVLDKWSFDAEHENSAIRLIDNSLRVTLFDDFSLQKLAKDKRLDEMEFYLPLEKLQIENLKQLLFKHLPKQWQVVRDAVETLDFKQVEGYLKGYIDLIFEHQGKYYLADYKSNTLTAYDQDNLLKTMADSHYYLQYLLYSVALHRYLQKRIAQYSWDSHFGGAYYLFIRGMNPEEKSVKKGGDGFTTNSSGVFFHKPERELIEAMDSLFGQPFIPPYSH